MVCLLQLVSWFAIVGSFGYVSLRHLVSFVLFFVFYSWLVGCFIANGCFFISEYSINGRMTFFKDFQPQTPQESHVNQENSGIACCRIAFKKLRQ